MPSISVILPCYNGQHLLPSCLASLRAQDFVDAEFLLIDDGSTDGSGGLMDEAAAADARFLAFHQENRGVSCARNAGLERARGRYILFVDADDLLLPGALSALWQCAVQAGHPDILTSDYQVLNEDLTMRGVRLQSRAVPEIIGCLIRGNGDYNAPWAKLYRRLMLVDHRVSFSPALRIGEDLLFNLAAFKAARTVFHCPFVSYQYVKQPDSVMARGAATCWQAHAPMLEELDAFMDLHALHTPYFRDYVKLLAGLIYTQYGPAGGRVFSFEALPRILRGVCLGGLSDKDRVLYLAFRAGISTPAYRFFTRTRPRPKT